MKDTQQQKRLKLLVVGESCTDYYNIGSCTRISPEAPVPIFDYIKTSHKVGMAGNVTNNLKALGCDVSLYTTPAKDRVKVRYIDIKSGQQLLRVDRDFQPVNELVCYPAIGSDRCDDGEYDAVIISDYDKGFVTEEFFRTLREKYKDALFIVDSKKEDLSIYYGCILKINEYEFKKSNPKLSEYKAVIVTNGSDCVDLYCKGFHVQYDIPKVDIFDVTGAGDVFLAAFSYYYTHDIALHNNEELAFPMGIPISKAAYLASQSVTHAGTYTITKKDIHNANLCS